ncbi:MAG: GNAT family N-acetyltransferase, partial [bacterium]
MGIKEIAVIRSATEDDSESIARIYNHYILNTVITFEEQAVSAKEIAGRIARILSASLPYLVVVQDDRVIGYAYATNWHDRSAYRFSVETAVYLDSGFVGKRLGSTLYQRLLERLKERGLHVAMGGIALPNPGSVALHEKLGFRKVAHFNEVGFKFNKWI